MVKIYVAGPYSADNVIDVLKNIGRGEDCCTELFLMGYAPWCPWHDKDYVIRAWQKDFTIEMFYEYCLAWLAVSDAMLVIGDWQKSKGTINEIAFADKRGIPVFYDMESLIKEMQ